MDAQSAPNHEKPTLDDGDLFPELSKRSSDLASHAPPSRAPSARGPLASSRASALVHAFAGGRKSAPPPPPISLSRPALSRPAPQVAEVIEATPIDDDVETLDAREVEEEAETLDARDVEDDVETVDAREVQDDEIETLDARTVATDAELIEDAELADERTPAHAAAPITPVYDEELDDGPTVALPSPLSGPVPSLASLASRPPPSRGLPSVPSARLAPPPSKSLPPLRPPPSAPSLPSRPPLVGVSSLAAPAPYQSAPMASAPPPVAVLPADASGSGRLSSIPPVAESVFPPAPTRSNSRWPLFAAAAAALAVLGAGAAFTGAKALGYGGGGQGAVVVTAAGTGGKAVQGLKIFSDGKLTCESSPCRAELAAGTHFLHAEAPGYEPTATRAVSVGANGEEVLHIELSPKASATAKAAEETKSAATNVAAAPPETKQAEAPAKAEPAARREAKAEPASATKPAVQAVVKTDAPKPEPAAQATLNINSIPRSNVVLDGRPLGMTPQLGVSVSPGTHTVVFVHPELGRKVAGTSVKAGATGTVAVRFE